MRLLALGALTAVAGNATVADPSMDARVERVARALGQRYSSFAHTTSKTITDPGKGIALGNAAHIVSSNWLVALLSGRRLVVRNPILRALFELPQGVDATEVDVQGRWWPIDSKITTYAQMQSVLARVQHLPEVTGSWWYRRGHRTRRRPSSCTLLAPQSRSRSLSSTNGKL